MNKKDIVYNKDIVYKIFKRTKKILEYKVEKIYEINNKFYVVRTSFNNRSIIFNKEINPINFDEYGNLIYYYGYDNNLGIIKIQASGLLATKYDWEYYDVSNLILKSMIYIKLKLKIFQKYIYLKMYDFLVIPDIRKLNLKKI